MGDTPERICVVNCGLPAFACACYRSMFATAPSDFGPITIPADLSDAKDARIAELEALNAELVKEMQISVDKLQRDGMKPGWGVVKDWLNAAIAKAKATQ